MRKIAHTGASLLTLFLSLGTLICCVLPIIFVSIGLGAVIATLISQFPMLVTLSKFKIWVFLIALIFLIFTAWLLWRPGQSCPSDPKLATLCNKIQKWNKRIFWVALIIWLIGFGVTYIILPISMWLGGF